MMEEKEEELIAMYPLLKDYKHNTHYRQSFSRLAYETFRLDFERWYESGYWNDHYICYSYIDDEQVIANVSFNTMTLLIDGEEQRAIQFATVMTAPNYRQRGLAFQLMQEVLRDYEGEYDLYFLAANAEAMTLYERCGFVHIPETIDEMAWRGHGERQHPIDVPLDELIAHKRRSVPFSQKLSALDDEHVLAFYYLAGFHAAIYPVAGGYVMYEIEDDILLLYAVWLEDEWSLATILDEIVPDDVARVRFMFTPDERLAGMTSYEDFTTNNRMIRVEGAVSFPEHVKFPMISQT